MALFKIRDEDHSDITVISGPSGGNQTKFCRQDSCECWFARKAEQVWPDTLQQLPGQPPVGQHIAVLRVVKQHL